MFFKKPTVTPLKTVAQEEVPWKSDTLLLHIENGKGALTFAGGQGRDGFSHSFLLMNGTPLSKWHNEYGCPTCESLLSAGYGRDRLDPEAVRLVKQAGNLQQQPLHETVLGLKPLLSLLPTGLFALSFLKLSPTDGDGEFFWNLTNRRKRYRSSCDTYFHYQYSSGYPAFLLPTQPSTRYHQQQVDKYREQIQKGASFGGVAYYLGGYLCALLDGHHRATASLLEGKDFHCLTIMPANGISPYQSYLPSSISFGGEMIPCHDLPDSIMKKAANLLPYHSLTTEQVEKHLSLEQPQDPGLFPEEVHLLAKQQPTYFGLSALQLIDDVSDERLERLFLRGETEWDAKLELAFHALKTNRDPRTKDIAMQICKSEDYLFLWMDAFHFLATIQSEEIEDFFIDFLVHDERKRPEITAIADEYLSRR